MKYPSDSSFIKTLSHGDKNNLLDFRYSKIDTSITNFQNYFPRNTNGHLGMPSAPLYIDYKPKALGFNMLTAPYQNDVISADDVQYYQTKGPYASLTGIAGSKQEQAFKMVFSNTFKNKLNITLGFNRYGGLGFYTKQQSFTNNFYTTSNYSSANKRVGYFAHVLYNKVKHQENGGIADDSLFLLDVSVNKILLPVNLQDSKRELRTTSFEINPWLRINKIEDSSTVISHFMDYQFNYSGSYTKYSDTRSGANDFFNAFYLDTVSTKDSTHWRTISNALDYTVKLNTINAKLRLGAKNEINQVYQYLDSTFVNNSVNAGFFLSKNKYSGFAKTSYIFSGPNANDYSLELSNSYSQSIAQVPFVFTLKASVEKRHPDFIHNTWLTNHYAWNNNFSPTDKLQSVFSISTLDDRFDMGVVYQSISNLIYFNELSVPEQTPVSIQNLGAFIHKDILLFKHLGINARYNYQSSSYQAIVSVPNHIVNGALYYQGNLFKRALQLQVGFNAQYYSEFYGYAYNPSVNQYYLQTKEPVGDYPFIDFFLNARIKPVRIFVKIDHVTQGFLGSNYSLTPGYLQNDRAFKFGINWLFFD
ncbi:MAG: hypothetical protein K0S26_2259 [Bacteroidota bacterium]|nr:hypothetical protein [Bacteroidota bacterium]